MIRVIVDSQSNRLFQGVAFEQAYDQRGGLCQIGNEGVLVTTNPIDETYLAYWQTLGFTLPKMFVAGPFDERATLSQLIINRPDLQRDILTYIHGRYARLEFFCIEESERRLAQILGLPAYCNFDVAIPLSRKPVFKRFFHELGLPTPWGVICKNIHELYDVAIIILEKGLSVIVKSEDGTGGISCGGMFRITSLQELQQFLDDTHTLGNEFVVEEQIPNLSSEVSIHWEITNDYSSRIVGIFNQFSPNFGYMGTSWPADITQTVRRNIQRDVRQKIMPALRKRNAIGHFCGDLVIDTSEQHYWIDFNPRKGAIRYIYDVACRIATQHFTNLLGAFRNEHLHLPENKSQHPYSFNSIAQRLKDLLIPNDDIIVVVTNPGVIPYGYVDITAIAAANNVHRIPDVFTEAKKRLLEL